MGKQTKSFNRGRAVANILTWRLAALLTIALAIVGLARLAEAADPSRAEIRGLIEKITPELTTLPGESGFLQLRSKLGWDKIVLTSKTGPPGGVAVPDGAAVTEEYWACPAGIVDEIWSLDEAIGQNFRLEGALQEHGFDLLHEINVEVAKVLAKDPRRGEKIYVMDVRQRVFSSTIEKFLAGDKTGIDAKKFRSGLGLA